MNEERRRFLRAYVPIPVHVYFDSSWQNATVMDISQNGLRIQVDDAADLNKMLSLRFGNSKDTFGVEVCWTKGSEIGCSFVSTLDEPSYNKIVTDGLYIEN